MVQCYVIRDNSAGSTVKENDSAWDKILNLFVDCWLGNKQDNAPTINDMALVKSECSLVQ